MLLFTGMLACMPSARLGSLPAISLVCPVSMVCLLQLQLPVALLYPRICWSALFRGYACLYAACTARFFTREFDSLPCFAGMLVAAAVAGCASLPANSIVCLVSRVCLLQLQLPDALLYPRILVFSLSRALSVYTSVVIPVSIC